MANAPSHGLLAELCTLMQRSNEGQRAMHKSIEALAECWRMSASASTSGSEPLLETRLQRLYAERTRPAYGTSDAYLHLGKQILEQGREQNRVLDKIHEKAHHAAAWGGAPTGREETDAKRGLQCWARGETDLLSRHVQEKLVQMVYEHGDCEAVEHSSPTAATDKRRIELATVVFWKGSQGHEPFLYDVFSGRGDNMRGLLELMPSVRKMLLEAAAQADVQLGESAASGLPFGKQRARIEDALGEFPEGLQALHELVLPVDRKWRPDVQVRDAEAAGYIDTYDKLPQGIKRFVQLGMTAGLVSRTCIRVAATEMVVKWCRHISELCYKQWALDLATLREAEAQTDAAEEQQREQVDKRLIEGFLATDYPLYRKISEDYDALLAEGSVTDGEHEQGAQGGDAPSRASA